jgi:ribosomal protein S18
LGKAEDAPKVVAGASARAQEISPRRIHPHRLFYPGATYSPEELNPYKAKDIVMRSDLTVRRGTIPTQVVKDQADFRNVEFLQYFMKDTGKLFPRRKTCLPAKVHRELMREIKISRVLALSNPLKKL